MCDAGSAGVLSPLRANMRRITRKAIMKFQPYKTGKPIGEVKRELGLKSVYKLASNENPEGPSPMVIKAMEAALAGINRYPDGGCYCLKDALSGKLGVKASNIILGSGTDEIIEIIGKTFLEPSDEIIVSKHAFIRYRMAGELMGCRVRAVPMKNMKHDLAAMKKVVTKKTKIIFIANPNNPTGTYVNAGELARFFKGLSRDIIVVMDEAYYEYMTAKDYPMTIGYVKKGARVIVLRTFSKIYSLAGLRVGYGIAPEPIISMMERIRPPFNVNSVAQAAAIASLKDKGRVKRCRARMLEGRRLLEKELKKSALEFVPSEANFILIRTGNGRKWFDLLLGMGVIVRAMDEYELPGWIRVTVGTQKENEKFIRAIRKIVNEKN